MDSNNNFLTLKILLIKSYVILVFKLIKIKILLIYTYYIIKDKNMN